MHCILRGLGTGREGRRIMVSVGACDEYASDEKLPPAVGRVCRRRACHWKHGSKRMQRMEGQQEETTLSRWQL